MNVTLKGEQEHIKNSLSKNDMGSLDKLLISFGILPGDTVRLSRPNIFNFGEYLVSFHISSFQRSVQGLVISEPNNLIDNLLLNLNSIFFLYII